MGEGFSRHRPTRSPDPQAVAPGGFNIRGNGRTSNSRGRRRRSGNRNSVRDDNIAMDGAPMLGDLGNMFLRALEEAHLERALAESQRDYQHEPKGPPPTKVEILNQLKEVCLDVVDIKDGNEHCTICMEEQECGGLALMLPCGHAFHKKCVFPWLQKHCTCPVCRLELNNMDKEVLDRDRRSHLARQQRLKNEREMQLQAQKKKMEELNKEDEAKRMEQVAKNQKKKDLENVKTCSVLGENGYGSQQLKSKEYTSPPGKKHCVRHGLTENRAFETLSSSSSSTTSANSVSSSAYSSTGANGERNSKKSNWTVRELRDVLSRLGLDDKARIAVEKSELINFVYEASNTEALEQLSVKELKKRLRYMRVSFDSVFDKRGLVELVQRNVSDIVDRYD